MSKTQVPRPLIEVFLCFDSEAQCCTDPESQWGGGGGGGGVPNQAAERRPSFQGTAPVWSS